MRDAVALSVRDPSLPRVLLLLSVACGYSLGTLEVIGPALFSDLAGSATGGSAGFGVVMAASFVGAATGYALAQLSRRLARGSTRWAVTLLSLLSGLARLGVASARIVVLAATAYACFYPANAAAWPLLRAAGHGRVAARQRATVVSAWSLALQVGGALASLVSPRLGGSTRAYVLAGGLAGLAGLLALGLPHDLPAGEPTRGPQDRAPRELTG